MGAAAAPSVTTAWTTADWALVVSLFSFAVSLAGFVWAVWSKWVYPKARVKVSMAVMQLISEDDDDYYIGFYATNFGPSDTTLKLLVNRWRPDGWAWRFKLGNRRWRYGVLMSTNNIDHAIRGAEGPMHPGLPHKLTIGGEFGTYTTHQHHRLRDLGVVDVGFTDVFGTTHWAPRRDIRKVIADIRKEWPKEA